VHQSSDLVADFDATTVTENCVGGLVDRELAVPDHPTIHPRTYSCRDAPTRPWRVPVPAVAAYCMYNTGSDRQRQPRDVHACNLGDICVPKEGGMYGEAAVDAAGHPICGARPGAESVTTRPSQARSLVVGLFL
jgi:hypothetical protein